jgi:hypothetical protein
MNFLKKVGKKVQGFFALLAVLAVTFYTSVANAAPTIDDVWTAVDLSGISAKIIPIMVLVVGISMIFLAVRYIKRTIKSA